MCLPIVLWAQFCLLALPSRALSQGQPNPLACSLLWSSGAVLVVGTRGGTLIIKIDLTPESLCNVLFWQGCREVGSQLTKSAGHIGGFSWPAGHSFDAHALSVLGFSKDRLPFCELAGTLRLSLEVCSCVSLAPSSRYLMVVFGRVYSANS